MTSTFTSSLLPRTTKVYSKPLAFKKSVNAIYSEPVKYNVTSPFSSIFEQLASAELIRTSYTALSLISQLTTEASSIFSDLSANALVSPLLFLPSFGSAVIEGVATGADAPGVASGVGFGFSVGSGVTVDSAALPPPPPPDVTAAGVFGIFVSLDSF